jgi:Flp pilus assembly pilin Flp
MNDADKTSQRLSRPLGNTFLPWETRTMKTILSQLKNDEAGFIISAELVLVSTIVILAMVVGLSEVSHNINDELEDVGSAFGGVNQSYHFALSHGAKGCMKGSCFSDQQDECDSQWDVSCNGGTASEN